jgi:hypothetical protein
MTNSQISGITPLSSQSVKRCDRGSILIAISFVGLFSMLLSGGLITHFAIAEARAVSDNLAKLRVYWAMMGHIDYTLSRMRAEHPDNTTNWPVDIDNANSIQISILAKLDELRLSDAGGTKCRTGPTVATTIAPTDVSKCSSWRYREVASDYLFHFRWTVFDTNVGNDGQFTIRIEYAGEGPTLAQVSDPTSSIPSLNGLSNRLQDLEVAVCFIELSGGTFQNCGDFSNAPGGNISVDDFTGASRITNVRRCRYDSSGRSGPQAGTIGTLLSSDLETDNTSEDLCTP